MAKPKQRKIEVIQHTNEDGSESEPYRILSEIQAVPRHFAIRKAVVALMWHRGWSKNQDGLVTHGCIRLATEHDIALIEQAGGTAPDAIIDLNWDLWRLTCYPTQNKRHVIDHELFHLQPALDGQGDQKEDAKGRKIWRLRQHAITTWPELIDIYGEGVVFGANEIAESCLDDEDAASEADAAEKDAERALIAFAEKQAEEKAI